VKPDHTTIERAMIETRFHRSASLAMGMPSTV
jgi:hypothetical protein